MIKTKKWMAGIMAAAMTAGMLTGCGGGGQTQNSAGTAEADSATQADAGSVEETETIQDSAAKTYNGQDVSEPVELVMYYIGDRPEDEDKVLDQINDLLQEKINATLTLKNLSMSDYSTKYSLTLAGGECRYDLYFYMGILSVRRQ